MRQCISLERGIKGVVTVFAALAMGLVTASPSAAGETATYTYDVHGQVTGVSRSTGTTSTYAYDLAANRSQVSTSSGLRAAATSDAAPAVTQPVWSDFSESPIADSKKSTSTPATTPKAASPSSVTK